MQKKISFRADQALDCEQVKSLRQFARRSLAVGLELETEFETDVPESRLKEAFRTQGSYTFVNDDGGVVRFYKDCSLSMGWELVLVGTSESYSDYHARLASIEKKLSSLGAKITSNCGAHASLVLRQNRRIPGVVIKNFYQLFRMNADALLWLVSATKKRQRRRNAEKDWIVRERLKQFANPVLKYTPVDKTLKHVKKGCTKYKALNMDKLRYISPGEDCGEMFIEIRIPDRHQVSHATTALAIMWQAMFLKAVLLSEFGLITLEDGQYEATKVMVERVSNGERLTPEEKKYLAERSAEFLALIRPELVALDAACISVLEELARKPISERYRGRTCNKDEQIEQEFEKLVCTRQESSMGKKLREMMALGGITAENSSEWKKLAATELGVHPRTVEKKIAALNRGFSKCYFDSSAGAFVLAC